MSISNDVWDRSGGNELNQRVYSLALGAFIAFGIAVSAVAAKISYNWEISWLLLIGLAIPAFAGIFVALGSEDPFVSLIGYTMITIPMGLLTGPAVAQYTDASVVRIFLVTCVVVVSLGIFGAVIPQDLEGWGNYLFGGLSFLLFGLIAVPIASWSGLPVDGAMTWLDWIGVAVFSGYVIFDFNRAMRVPHTLDNAIDCAVAVYLDFLNLFLILLQLFGDSKSRD